MSNARDLIRIALFTAASCAGKSTLSGRIEKELRIPVLLSDTEVFSRSFKVLKRPELIESINPLSSWAWLRKQYDFDRLFRLHHRDWYARSEMPRAFVAQGWIYCRKDWRSQVRSAFERFQFRQFCYRLFILNLEQEEFLRRFLGAQEVRLAPHADFFSKSEAEKAGMAFHQYREFKERELERPDSAEMECEECWGDDELVERLAAYLH